MALRSALSLGINLRLTDNQTPNAAKEARGRLWWSIYSMEHLLASMTGRASCVSEGLCSVPTPLPCEEESFNHPEANRLFQDPTLRESQLCPTLYEHSSQFDTLAWVSTCPPCPSLFFHCLVDLNLITHALINKVYSIEGLRTGPSQVDDHLQKLGARMDRWLLKLPPFYQFTLREAGPWSLDHAKLDDLSAPFARDRVCLAMNYYSARITLCRPCLTHIHPQSSHNSSPNLSARAKLRIHMATNCLQASCAMISILPEDPNMPWLARTAPWWVVLHYLMQATTALLLGISHCSPSGSKSPQKSPNGSLATFGSPPQPTVYQPLLETDLNTAIESIKKAMRWLYVIASVDPAARRAFVFCDRIVKRIAPGFDIDLRNWPDGSSFVEAMGPSWGSNGNRRGHGHEANDDYNGNGNENGGERSPDGGSGMEAFEELVDFEGGVS